MPSQLQQRKAALAAEVRFRSRDPLALNPKKTSIRELPLPLEAVWATQLKRAKPRAPAAQQAADLTHLFDIAVALHKDYPGEAVLQSAISLLQFEAIHSQNWPLFQRLVMLCSLPEPACFPNAIRQIVLKMNAGVTLIPEIAQIANALIVAHSPLRHSSEVAMAAYACLALGLTMNDAAVDAISKCDDSVVALLALDCEQRNLTSKPLDKTLWLTHMCADELYDEFWLLAYEANIKGWLPNVGGVDFVAADSNFGPLKVAGVHFYDGTLNMSSSPPVTAPIATAPGASDIPAGTTIPTQPSAATPVEAVATPETNATLISTLPETAAVPPAETVVPADPIISW